MKNILKRLAVPLIALTLGSCATTKRINTYKPTEHLGKVDTTITWTNPLRTYVEAYVEADSTSFIVEGHPDIKQGDLCSAKYFRRFHPWNGRQFHSIEIDFSELKGTYPLAGKKIGPFY